MARLSAERTLLAWVRTAVALVALGLVLAKFSLVLRSLDPRLALGGTRRLSLLLVLAGGLVDVAAGAVYVRRAAARGLTLLAVLVVAAAAAYATVYVVPR